MKYFHLFLSVLLVSGYRSQTAVDAAVQLQASTQLSPPTITLSWVGNASTSQYTVYRKLKSATSWGLPVATLSGTVNQYVDNTVSVGVSYEYQVARSGTPNYFGHGFINAGIQIPAVENRGNLILVVDSFFIASLANELKQLEEDLEGDGWTVKRLDVLRTGSITNVKAKIQMVYNQDPVNTKAVFIFGHVPVPYSGNLNPDGHPDHLGAWPTDTYYGEMNGSWTDVAPPTTTLSPARTQNLPGDKKWDQTQMSSQLEMMVGRVDLFAMPAFTLTETQLMQNYLNKDHDYRKKVFSVQKQAVIDDNFGFMNNEAFAASGYHNFSPLVGTANISATDYFTALSATNTSYQWSYGCGGGSFTSAGGVGTTANFASSNLQGIFTMLFGSYFGDWDVSNSFLRAPLAQGKMLTCSWSGRPHHQYHHMALGETIGYCMMTTQNWQNPLYFPNIYGITGAWVHNGLMGDPTLRNDVVAPVSSVVATKAGNNCQISWAASPEPGVLGYNVYMKNDTNKTYTKINNTLVAGTTYTDYCLLHPGIYKYMVRALKLETTPSGTYYNLSEGIADTALNNNNLAAIANFSFAINNNTVNFTNLSSNAITYSWNFGNGTSTSTNPVNTYTSGGTYTVTLIASNGGCGGDTVTQVININIVALNERFSEEEISIYPNPTTSYLFISQQWDKELSLEIFNNLGELVIEKKVTQRTEKINLSTLAKGVYLLKINDGENKSGSRKLIIE